jgi:hypothetical protein
MFEKYRIVYMTIRDFQFPVVTVRVVLCLLDLAMPTAEMCHYLYCTLLITKLKCVLCLIHDGILLTNRNALVSTMKQSRFLIISLFQNVDLYITDHNKGRYFAAREFMILSFISGTVEVELTLSAAALQFWYCSLHYLHYV